MIDYTIIEKCSTSGLGSILLSSPQILHDQRFKGPWRSLQTNAVPFLTTTKVNPSVLSVIVCQFHFSPLIYSNPFTKTELVTKTINFMLGYS